jgi:hypothetical protein
MELLTTSLVLQGYLAGLPRAVLRGGRYDPLAEQFRPGARAIGFALYLDELDRLADAPAETDGKVMLNVALPKGRLGDRVYRLLAGVGYGCPENYSDTRKLVVENREAASATSGQAQRRAIYVELGGPADIASGQGQSWPSPGGRVRTATPAFASAACAWLAQGPLPRDQAGRCGWPPSS